MTPVNGTSLLERLRSYTGVGEQRIKGGEIMTKAQFFEQWHARKEAEALAAIPSIEEVLASPDSPRVWIDPEYEEIFDKVIAQAKDSPTRGSHQWKKNVYDSYRRCVDEYYQNGGVIPFVPETDEQLQELLQQVQWRYSDEVKALHNKVTTPEHLQEIWIKANEGAKRIRCYRKDERQQGRIFKFKRSIDVELQYIKEWWYNETHPPPPPPPKPEIELPPGWFAEDDEGAAAKTIEELNRLLAPIIEQVLEEWSPLLEKWYPDTTIRVAEEYVYFGTAEKGFKVSRVLGCYWDMHHGKVNPVAGDILNLFKEITGIDDDTQALRKLNAIWRRIEREDPEIRAQKALAREKRKLKAEKEFLDFIKEEMSDFFQRKGTMTPPPTGPKKRAKKTARAFWEWIFPPDGLITADHVKGAFEYWEKTGDDLYFRVESKVYPKMTNWVLTATGITPITRLLKGLHGD
jgi:hypothetical protein